MMELVDRGVWTGSTWSIVEMSTSSVLNELDFMEEKPFTAALFMD